MMLVVERLQEPECQEGVALYQIYIIEIQKM